MSDVDVDAIVEDLTTTGFHLGVGTKDWLRPEQLAAYRQAVRDGDVPVHLVLVRPPEDGSISWADDLLVRIHDAGGPDGLYLGVNNVWDLDDEPAYHPILPSGDQLNMAVQQWGEVGGSTDVGYDVDSILSSGGPDGGPPELGDGVLQVVEGVAGGDLEEAADTAREQGEARREAEDSSGSGSGAGSTGQPSGDPYDDGSTSDALVGFVVIAVAVAAVGLGIRSIGRRARARQATEQAARPAFALPDSVLDRVREAGDADLARRAQAAVLALGEHIDAADLDGSSAPAWAAALDHYDAARRLLPEATVGRGDDLDPLDAVGAVVLAGRGEEALAAARKGRSFVPTTPCFLNPLHGRATRDRTLEHDGRRVDAPVCVACRRDLKAGRRPDILDVVVDGRPEHYFETDREPWASTGFGALEPDLVRRLHRGGRR